MDNFVAHKVGEDAEADLGDNFRGDFFVLVGVLTTIIDFAVFNLLTGRKLRWRRIPANIVSVSVATVGNSLGALTTYAIGVWGGPWLIERVLRVDPSRREQAEQFYARYGVWSLLLSWVPVIGDPLCLVGGLMRVPLFHYSILVTIGKYVRYQTIAWMVLATM